MKIVDETLYHMSLHAFTIFSRLYVLLSKPTSFLLMETIIIVKGLCIIYWAGVGCWGASNVSKTQVEVSMCWKFSSINVFTKTLSDKLYTFSHIHLKEVVGIGPIFQNR